MAELNLAPDEKAALIELLRDTIDRDRFPMSPRMKLLRSILEARDTLNPTRGAGPGFEAEIAPWRGAGEETAAVAGMARTLHPTPPAPLPTPGSGDEAEAVSPSVANR